MIILVDCNSFFCSCERLFRPDLNDSPVIVLSNNDGCVIARTSEAKKLNIPMVAPFFKIKELCKKNGVSVFSSNFPLYTNISNRVMESLKEFSSDIEIYSIDEAFLEIKIREIDTNWKEIGNIIKKTVEKDVGIPVSVGIAPTKTLAKIANNMAKKRQIYKGVCCILGDNNNKNILESILVGEIWGIGKKQSIKLNILGIKNAYEFKKFNNIKLIGRSLGKTGMQIKSELNGIVCFSILLKTNNKKEIMCSRSFSTPVETMDDFIEYVSLYISSSASKLRLQNSICCGVEVFAMTGLHDLNSYFFNDRKKVLESTNDTRVLLKSALEIVKNKYRSGMRYKKIGIRLYDIYNLEHCQLDMFTAVESKSDQKLMEIIDKINSMHGDNILKFASSGVQKSSVRINQGFKSPRYVSSWNELPPVH